MTVPTESIPKGVSVLCGRFVHTLKTYLTPEETEKVRYVAEGFDNTLKRLLAHDVTALKPASIRLILCLATTCKLQIFSHDVTKAYFQCKDKLSRQVYLCPKSEDQHLFGV